MYRAYSLADAKNVQLTLLYIRMYLRDSHLVCLMCGGVTWGGVDSGGGGGQLSCQFEG